jgi:hypothetical protein
VDAFIERCERRELVKRCIFACSYLLALDVAALVLQFIASRIV